MGFGCDRLIRKTSKDKTKIAEYKLKIIVAFIAGALLTGGAWHQEIVKLRAIHGESYSLPFFLTTDFNYVFWSIFWFFVIVSSYVLLFVCTQISWKEKKIIYKKTYLLVLSILLFSIAIWQLEVYQLKDIKSEPYTIPFTSYKTREPMELTGGEEVFIPFFESSFWGDVWMMVITLSYALLFVRML